MNNKIVTRMCIFTRNKCDRKDLFRVVKTKEGEILIDMDGSIQGRGTYISKDKEVILKAKKKDALSRGLKCKVPEEIYDQLLNLL